MISYHILINYRKDDYFLLLYIVILDLKWAISKIPHGLPDYLQKGAWNSSALFALDVPYAYQVFVINFLLTKSFHIRGFRKVDVASKSQTLTLPKRRKSMTI